VSGSVTKSDAGTTYSKEKTTTTTTSK
jgi:hypothetical protein